jgi:ADP-ribose pyrophosphatase YjhB (NUDIX family)
MEIIKPKNFCGKVAIKIFLEEKNGNLLIVRQKQDEPFEVPGGRVDEEESIDQAVQRELQEELGVRMENVKYEIVDSFQAINPSENINHLYLIVNIKLDDDVKSRLQYSEEIKEMVWIHKENYINYNYKKFLDENIIKYISKKI